MSVNELAENWRQEDVIDPRYAFTPSECADELEELARTAWHPVSEPPTAEDADDLGCVFAEFRDTGRVNITDWWVLTSWPGSEQYSRWARLDDVLLMPPQGGE